MARRDTLREVLDRLPAPSTATPPQEGEGVRVAAARWQDADDLSRALGIATGDLHWHELIERVRQLAPAATQTEGEATSGDDEWVDGRGNRWREVHPDHWHVAHWPRCNRAECRGWTRKGIERHHGALRAASPAEGGAPIETVGQLDALPDGSIVGEGGRPTILAAVKARGRWRVTGMSGSCPSAGIGLPACLLTPEATVTDRWRTGGHNPYTAYRVADGAHDQQHAREHFLGSFRHAEDAQLAVDAVNALRAQVDPDDVRARVAALAAEWERSGEECGSHVPTVCRLNHDHDDAAAECEDEDEPVDTDDVEWDTMATGYREHAAALRELLAGTVTP
jgi:hypothetical protein